MIDTARRFFVTTRNKFKIFKRKSEEKLKNYLFICVYIILKHIKLDVIQVSCYTSIISTIDKLTHIDDLLT
jgi:hypothetical protein